MNQITLDANLSKQLHAVGQSVELCDPDGRVIGRFVPLLDLSGWEPVTPEISEEELNRREREGGRRYTTEEVIAYLEKL